MQTEKITVIQPESGKTLEVVVLSKRVEHIEVVIGEGVHSVKCDLHPAQSGKVYVGKVMGRELIYERSREQVQADIDRINPLLHPSKRR